MTRPSAFRLPAALALLTLVLLLLLPALAPFDPMQTDPGSPMQPPSGAHLLGTDMFGRDVLSRVLVGGRTTFLTALTATLIAVVPGMSLGLLARGPWAQALDTLNLALLALPGLLLAFVVLTLVGVEGVALGVGLAQVAPCVQVARGLADQIRAEPYIESAIAAGAHELRVTARHVLPNALPVLAAYATVIFSYSLLNSAALAFLGFGTGAAEWGLMLAEGRAVLRDAPWVSVAPGAALTALVMTLTTLADARE